MGWSKRRTACWGGIGMAVLAGLAAIGTVDNTARAQVYGLALPDISNKTLILRPDTVHAGGTVEIVSAVQNRGSGALTPRYPHSPPAPATPATPATDDGARLEPPAPPPPTLIIRFVLVTNVKNANGMPAGEWGLDALEQRGVESHTALWTVPPETAPDTWYLCADVDPDKSVRESNELNNRTCQRLIVKPPLEPEAAGPGPEGSDLPAGEDATAEEDSDPGFSGLDSTESSREAPN